MKAFRLVDDTEERWRLRHGGDGEAVGEEKDLVGNGSEMAKR